MFECWVLVLIYFLFITVVFACFFFSNQHLAIFVFLARNTHFSYARLIINAIAECYIAIALTRCYILVLIKMMIKQA